MYKYCKKNKYIACFCSEMQGLEPVCITLGDQQTIWILDIHGNLWFRTGVVSKKPQGDDNHWWQVGISYSTSSIKGDYLVVRLIFLTCIPDNILNSVPVRRSQEVDLGKTHKWNSTRDCHPKIVMKSYFVY